MALTKTKIINLIRDLKREGASSVEITPDGGVLVKFEPEKQDATDPDLWNNFVQQLHKEEVKQ